MRQTVVSTDNLPVPDNTITLPGLCVGAVRFCLRKCVAENLQGFGERYTFEVLFRAVWKPAVLWRVSLFGGLAASYTDKLLCSDIPCVHGDLRCKMVSWQRQCSGCVGGQHGAWCRPNRTGNGLTYRCKTCFSKNKLWSASKYGRNIWIITLEQERSKSLWHDYNESILLKWSPSRIYNSTLYVADSHGASVTMCKFK